ncbi:PP2C family protein-serine/threonine phosphatase [Komagataeibacter melomenusus]
MTFRFAKASEVGPRSENEDTVCIWGNTAGWIAVALADGLGGYNGGQEASSTAVKVFRAGTKGHGQIDLRGIALAAHEKIRLKQKNNPIVRGMATTLSAAVIDDRMINFVHCGDSRIALQRGMGIRRLTIDHTEAQRLLDEGALSRDEYAVYPRKNILDSALGVSENPRIDVGSHDLLPGDRIFFTSDGIHSKIFIREIMNISSECQDPEEIVARVIATVNERGPEDNFTIAVVFVD